MSSKLWLVVTALVLATCSTFAQDYVPDELEGWQRWVLKDKEYRGCPFYFNRGATERGDFLCAWPGRLQLDVTASGGRFTQQWTVHGTEQWLALPGSPEYWPDRVTANDRAVEVIARNEVPSIRVAPGSYRISGRFVWDERPGVLSLPPESGLLGLTIDGREIARPDIDQKGVFLGERKRDTRAVDSVRTVVYRLVADDVPTRIITQLQIDVSGSVREELFGPILPEGFVPLHMQTPLPAKFEADGRLRLQVRPGRWVVNLSARGPGVLNEITSLEAGSNLPESEVWSYQSNDRVRVTAVEGLPPVDPAQVDVPGNWQSYPAFRVDVGKTFTITERSRGVVSAANELSLARTMWLDFDGGGFVVQDDISGQMRTGWRLDMAGSYALLSATENGENLLITNGEAEGQTGVEVRQTDVDLQTLARSNTRGAMPATGWDARFAQVEANLNLPPGNKLLTAPGVDVAHGSWISEWQLLDFFLVLIITIAVWRLFNPTAGVIALLALALSFHELFAPTWLWLNLLAAIALLRVTPEGRLRNLVRGYQLLSAAAIVAVLVPFIAGQLRVAIYPQLEPQYKAYDLYAETPPVMEQEMLDRRVSKQAAEVSRPRNPDLALEQLHAALGRSCRSGSEYAPDCVAALAG
jgi:hypothetical protein